MFALRSEVLLLAFDLPSFMIPLEWPETAHSLGGFFFWHAIYDFALWARSQSLATLQYKHDA